MKQRPLTELIEALKKVNTGKITIKGNYAKHNL